MQDAELDAMMTVNVALARLDGAAAARVLRWAFDRYGAATSTPTPQRPLETHLATSEHARQTQHPTDSIADFYAAAAPSSESEKALVIAYWLQEVDGKRELDAMEVNTRLKHLGHRVANITRALNDLITARPQLVIQTRKGGATRQARKAYRVTSEGLRRVGELLARPHGRRVAPITPVPHQDATHG